MVSKELGRIRTRVRFYSGSIREQCNSNSIAEQKRTTEIAGLTAICIAISLFAGCQSEKTAESATSAVLVCGMKCIEPIWKVGTIDPKAHRELKKTFVLQNESDREVDIESVKGDCGCITTENSASKVSPQKSAEVFVKFFPPPNPGAFERRVMVSVSAGVDRGVLELRVRGASAPTKQLLASPSILDFGTLTSDKKTRTTRVSRYDGSQLGVTSIVNGLAKSTLHTKEIQDGRIVEISVTLSGGQKDAGTISESIVLNTSDPVHRTIEIPIKGIVESDAEVFVTEIFIESASPGRQFVRSIFRTGIVNEEFQNIRIAYVGDPRMTVTYPPHENTDMSEGIVQVRILSDDIRGVLLRGKINVISDQSGRNLAEIPIVVFVK
jgi:hypothetical protein